MKVGFSLPQSNEIAEPEYIDAQRASHALEVLFDCKSHDSVVVNDSTDRDGYLVSVPSTNRLRAQIQSSLEHIVYLDKRVGAAKPQGWIPLVSFIEYALLEVRHQESLKETLQWISKLTQ